ncbi:hypothetical protein MUCCIDRAFT_155181 [Mucor lusitanicus CBS 277.49]|uniref:Uncharacterized protein n=1 Tax=Mucor lusitanicus CBS 277.49 TaxID=747725 RepID=A0A168N7N4_MUCCL|nr:hypothetical protein MUCCIDRAFT_155181 [Mucor lusitanicus CBS 277.49]
MKIQIPMREQSFQAPIRVTFTHHGYFLFKNNNPATQEAHQHIYQGQEMHGYDGMS